MKRGEGREGRENRMMVLDIEAIRRVDPELAMRVNTIHRELMTLRYLLEEAKQSEREAWAENSLLQAELKAAKKEIETLKVGLSRLTSSYEEKVREANQLRLEVEDLRLKKAIATESYNSLIEALEDMWERIAEKYTEEIPQAIREDMMNNIQSLVDNIRNVLISLRGIPIGGEVGKAEEYAKGAPEEVS
ncbi:MAG TPA: hypothetical protein ENG66_05590 [Thermococcus sp.]|nr:hypothetical protein [Thermococcus sp.]